MLYTALALCACHFARGATVSGPIPAYRFKLSLYASPRGGVAGLLIHARINGGPELRLLLDSGAQYIVLDQASAKKSDCEGGSEIELIGAGSPDPGSAKKQIAESVQLGAFELHQVPLILAGRKVAEGIQGAMPLAIFADYVVRLDIPGRVLELFTDAPDAAGSPIEAVNSHGLLFLKGTVDDDGHSGYFLFDTGASVNGVAYDLAEKIDFGFISFRAPVPLQGGVSKVDAPLLGAPLGLHFGEVKLPPAPAAAIDLSEASRRHGLKVSGLLGFPALKGAIVTVNYRENQVRIQNASTPRTESAIQRERH